jgi:AraC-like DNA-binding protein
LIKPNADLSDCMLHWDLVQDQSISSRTQIRSRRVDNVRIAEIAGGECRGYRGDRHRENDKGDFVAIVCKFEGRELCSSDRGDVVVSQGDMMIWRNRGNLSFRAAEWSRQLLLIVPSERFDAALRTPLDGGQMILPGNSPLGALAPQFMSAFCQNFERMAEREAEIAVEMALDLVASAIDGEREVAVGRTTLYDRIIRHIERSIQDPDLTPADIANAHGISRRYLHQIFAHHGHTVSGWIREQRLLRSREELDRNGAKASVTEIAYRWGFCDSAHFSRAFRQRFGMPPGRWRDRAAAGN